jgi:hypothetical protein
MDVAIPGFVALYETREAARFCGYNWKTWLTIDADEQALCVAQYRAYFLMQANVNDAVNRASARLS